LERRAAEAWATIYPHLSRERPGLLGSILSRAESQTTRLALIYALLDASHEIGITHLRAALAVWQYAEDSARLIFGDRLGDHVADEILMLLRSAPAGVTRTEIVNHFARHVSAERLDAALRLLLREGLASPERRQTAGRPMEVWKSRRATS
jgi:hypothetical protein